jgi:hypothetical protein
LMCVQPMFNNKMKGAYDVNTLGPL